MQKPDISQSSPTGNMIFISFGGTPTDRKRLGFANSIEKHIVAIFIQFYFYACLYYVTGKLV
jgi:hypothetical protein